MITVSSSREAVALRESCRLAARLRDELMERLAPGVTTQELDRFAAEWLGARGAKSWFKGYRGYPASICVSVNDEVVHGIPGPRRLLDGDLVSIDVGVVYGGFHSDTAASAGVGALDAAGRKLLDVTRRAMDAGIAAARAGARVGDISHAVQSLVEGEGFSVVREFVGHGIGRGSHEEPQIPNYGAAGRGATLVEGQALAIEPMVNEGGAAVRVREDGWTAVAADGRRSAHFEHTVLVTGGDPEILTVSAGEA